MTPDTQLTLIHGIAWPTLLLLLVWFKPRRRRKRIRYLADHIVWFTYNHSQHVCTRA